MASSSLSSCFPHQEDDEFDWEAAVKEIDVACQVVASTSNREDFHNSMISYPKRKTAVGARQSTLDKFVKSKGKCSIAPVSHLENGHQSCRLGDDSAYLNIDLEAAKIWIYPVNIPLRDYQLSITKTALFSNTLVALPTGLGKTLIAAVVMYNYFRWFPEGKIVFAAPSRPLVMQQIEACHNIMGIPQEWTIDMTGQINPSKRQQFWKAKRVFFVTPQVLEKDIQSGICVMKQLVCLVIDEAHRAMGNYSYCVAVRELMAVPVQLRIVALTATPGSKQRTIQNVIDNLHISTLEYRNESDLDVSSYVHNRKLELMEVSMGKDAIEINNLLLEAIQPFVSRLCSVGVLYKRDFATLSPCDLLTSRDKFRQAPPGSLPPTKYGEIDGCFGILITLYHIRKLLSSHGIRPAYEMLDEKLQQGSFARLMSRNEKMWRIKLLMQQSLSHGAPNPKLLKMIEVLIDHFKTNDPKDSRVIIFSNFRGSVKDIMCSLSNIGQFVKATQFIGQSSGKSLKGQTQKVQQEVLQKFRAGEYNVIVATSIGEEGLDIMEVDLVVCFDANISPLRMIQRMGRTGRKHDGRVVVLACQGPELKGYLKKQANGKTVRKHMHNGGSNSFNFHCSPRMVPHICKPEVQFVELSIEQFIPRGRKVKDLSMHKPSFKSKILDVEADIIAKYFHAFGEDTWRPSLVAFPHFQAFPSRVHKVMHSSRTTGMLIDTIQSLQGLLSFRSKQTLPDLVQLKSSSSQYLEVATVAGDDNDKIADSNTVHDTLKTLSESKTLDVEASSRGNPYKDDKHSMPDLTGHSPPVHCFLFGADFVSVNTFGRVLIASLPVFPFVKDDPSCEHVPSKTTGLLTNSPSRISPLRCDKLSVQPSANVGIMDSEARHTNKWIMPKFDDREQTLHRIGEPFPQTPNSDDELVDSEFCVAETPTHKKMETKNSMSSESKDDLRDVELSPRLSSFIEKGVVPESPVVESHRYSSTKEHMVNAENGESRSHSDHCPSNMDMKKNLNDLAGPASSEGKESFVPVHVSPDIPKSSSGPTSNELVSENKMVKILYHADEINAEMGNISGSPIKEIQTPLVNKQVHSSSEDWKLSSGEAPKSIQQPRKFKRLRKYVDIDKRLTCKTSKEALSATRVNLCRSFTQTKFNLMKHDTGKHMPKIHVTDFIEDEAEVSADAEVSEDEEDVKGDNEYDDSFIDDRMSSPSSNQAEVGGSDMMAIYRKSLLTQSPLMQSNYSTISGHEFVSPITAESGSCSKMVNNSLQTPQSNLSSTNQSTGRNSISCQLDVGRALLLPVTETHDPSTEDESKMDSRKRKLSFQRVGSIPVTSSRQECLFLSKAIGKASHLCQPESNQLNSDMFYDDQFYQGLDLDAVEAQATESLRYKTTLLIGMSQRENLNPEKVKEGLGLKCLNSPSFDLGI